MTVGEFKAMLMAMPFDSAVTFGSSSYSRRPLIFFRTKMRDERLLHIELNELSVWPDEPGYSEPQPEHEYRITVGDLLKELDVDDDWELEFGGTTDGCALKFKALTPAVAINLVQPDAPEYVEGPVRTR